MQQAIMHSDPRRFMEDLNAVMLDGWEIVPGSWGCAACQQVSAGQNHIKYTLPDGTSFVKFFFCVVHDENLSKKQGRANVASQTHGNGHER